MPRSNELPQPDASALAHSHRLRELIAGRIRAAGGWIPFSEYMDLALYAPGLGYYSAGAAKFGPAGDFVTAPEISPLFARCLARAVAPFLRDRPGAVVIEPGAGSGALAAGMLCALADLGALPDRYLILEVSADLRARQQQALARLPGPLSRRVHWLDRLPAQPLDALVIANEVADALPVDCFVRRHDGTFARGVACMGEAFGWVEQPAGSTLRAAVETIEKQRGEPLADGYCSEVSLRLGAWIAALGRVISTGALLLCDYGMAQHEYYHAERREGTLTCHYRHRAHPDPFLYPGLQDITAWVDFSAASAAGRAADLELCGYATQAHFLLDNGIMDELTGGGAGSSRERAELSSQVRTLLLPGEMGERFKVLSFSRGGAAIGGFGFRDLRDRL